MKCRKRSGLMVAVLFLLALLAGCGSSTTTKSVPTVEQIFYAHSVVFDNNSTLLTSGYNGFGQMGNATLVTPMPFVQSPFLAERVHGYAAGANHTLAFGNNSTMYAWGSNLHGRLGVYKSVKLSTAGTDAFSSIPIPVKMTNKVISIATGWNHSLAVAGPNRSVLAWGANNVGQLGNLGDQGFADFPFPTAVVGEGGTGTIFDNVKQVAAGGSHSLALREDGTVWSWGENTYGQLGYLTLPGATFGIRPKKVEFPATATAKVAEIAAAGSFSAARLEDGTVWVWGYNVYGQTATNPVGTAGFTFTPTQILNEDGTTFYATKISLGTMHVIALKATKDASGNLVSTGEVWGWGWNERGQLGLSTAGHDDNSLFIFHPQKATAIDRIGLANPVATDVYAFGTVSFARINGTLYGWGDNGFSQLGKVVPTNSIAILFTPVEYKAFSQ